MANKTIVNGLWLGSNRLTHLEYLTLSSFTDQGAEFHLWHYEPIIGYLPTGVVLRDGNEIIPKERIFRYPKKMLLGFGHESFVGFSELFRYKVLYEVGGWYSDMDVTCLKPLEEVTDDYYFRNHGVLSVVGNIMKTPPKSELMKRCYERACIEVNEEQDDWHHAIRILCYNIEYLGLDKYIRKNECNLDRIDFMWPYFSEEMPMDSIPQTWRFIHWMNSVMPRVHKAGSVFDQLLQKHRCTPKKSYI